MANLALNINVKWRVVLVFLVVVVVVAFYFLPSLKSLAGVSDGVEKAPVDIDGLHVEENYLKWGDKEQGIFYQQIIVKSSPLTVLLLHGMAYTSQTWRDETDTLNALASNGYSVVAVDLPEHGKSKDVKAPPDKPGKSKFLQDLVEALKLEQVVVVAPSMSGSYALPFVVEHARKLRGFIPVAPVIPPGVDEHLKTLALPTLIVYGEKDENAAREGKLKTIPQSEVYMMEGADHACYLKNPKEFNAKVAQFLLKLSPKAN